ncbi:MULTISPECIES: GNAT family N-acetyltransferase [Pyrobaculum]|uniref:GCN5-related N-acetyltransferase n=2 Tax=Pyrobaculum arsenaticum TaxID=121277 RepID=A4WLU1_PYRAR|nr:GNAT family N-acetyltransferase [Pyrobaculum arsenaticum]ABP51358.1 GCN5-related N-acetyltransferase [Pyrobaculum arsenaticum DSM 13514]MCY0889413.1 GNAT family N-acetyltransferase [Pyrobaculum arsenaticum]NYR16272.1 GNAT family N-acetyltransferase [Pyrobaculum arsenaticum]
MRTSSGSLEFREDKQKALEIIGLYYKGPVKYAKAILERWPRSGGIVAYMNGETAGAEIVYSVDLALTVCVHYYIAVVPEHRRKGVATQLIKKVEEICKAGVYMATTTDDNHATIMLFMKLGYKLYRWTSISKRARNILLKATCGYDDDVLLIKGGDPEEVVKESGDVEKLWRETCLKPYIGL